MKRLLVAALAVAVAAAAAFTASLALAATKPVGVKQVGTRYHFTVSHLTIHRGDTVRWSWRARVPHNVTGPGFHSRTANRLTFSHRFTKAGRYRVRCTIHAALGQRMVITVRRTRAR
jgi:plastocyanin